MNLVDLIDNDLSYSGVFLENGKHMTWNHGLPKQYPNGIKPGDTAELEVIGEYEDDDVACLIVTWNGETNQPKGTLLHITTKKENGVGSVESGRRATKNGYDKIDKPYTVKGVWK